MKIKNTISSAFLRRLFTFMLVLLFLMGSQKADADTLILQGISDIVSEQFQKDHPDTNLSYKTAEYRNTYELSAAMVTGMFEADVFTADNMCYDWNAIVEKGFCADLSGSEIIRDAVSRMHPTIRNQLTRGDRIVGIPESIQFDFLLVDDRGWAEAGYTDSDVPKTFSELLDFLQGWVDRCSAEEISGISVINSWDEELFSPASYSDWLTSLLIDSYIMQRQHAGLPLIFDDPSLPELLERTRAVGAAVYQTESSGVVMGNRQLIATDFGPGFTWPGKVSQRLVSPRIHEDQPHLLFCTMGIRAVYEKSQQKELAIAFLEDFLIHRRWFIDLYPSYFFMDGQPVKNPQYQESLDHWKGKIAETKAILAKPDISLGERNDAEVLLARFEGYLKETLKREYSLSPEQLADYKTMAPGLTFPMASPYVPWTDTGQNYEILRKQFVDGHLPARDFIQELMRIAKIMELEEGR